jgi:serine/threonine protein kinase
MSAPTSVEELLQVIRKSGVLDEQVLSDFLQSSEFTGSHSSDRQEFIDQMIAAGVITNFQAEQFLLGKWRGFTIGKYKLLERIGVGGMGQVFLCEHMTMKKHMAIKVLPPAKADQPSALGRFYREARAAAALDHPNVVRTHDIDQDGNLHFIVMDYVDGPNLMDVVKKFGALDIDRAVSYARQVALGLDYAFRNSIIHRDIKPGNVLINRKGEAMILDMGLALFLNDHTDQLTVKYDDKTVLGTADYVAPEQVANSHAVDTRADIYALGATLYYLLAGHPPFPTGTVSQKLLWHRTKDPTPIKQVRPEVSDALAAVLAKMMAKDLKARYQTPAQVAAALAELLPPVVPLPHPDEMPQLSPAARMVLGIEDGAPPVPTRTAPTGSDSPRVNARDPEPSAPPPTPPPRSASVPSVAGPAPFGSTGGSSPWGAQPAGSGVSPFPRRPSPLSNAALPIAEPMEEADEETTASRHTLTRDALKQALKPEKKSRTLLWVVIAAVLLAVVAAVISTQM